MRGNRNQGANTIALPHFAVFIEAIQTQPTLLEGSEYLPPDTSSPFRFLKNPKSYVLQKKEVDGPTSTRGPGEPEL